MSTLDSVTVESTQHNLMRTLKSSLSAHQHAMYLFTLKFIIVLRFHQECGMLTSSMKITY